MIRTANEEDSKEILDLIKSYSDNEYLSIEDIKEDIKLNNYSNYLVYEEDKKIIGVINFHELKDYAEIIDIVVKKEYRRKKIATKLMNETLKILGVIEITLEVRVSNVKAIGLYEKYDFKIVGTRKNYYKNEDAYIMKRESEE